MLNPKRVATQSSSTSKANPSMIDLLDDGHDTLAIHQLETTLRIVQTQPGQRAHDEVEGLSQRLTRDAFWRTSTFESGSPRDPMTISRSRSRAISAKAGVLFDRRGLIRVAHQHPAAPGFGDAPADRVALPPVLNVLDQDASSLGGQDFLGRDVGSPVRRSVIDDQHLGADAMGIGVAEDLGQRVTDPGLFVECRDDHGQVRPPASLLRHDSVNFFRGSTHPRSRIARRERGSRCG